MKIDNYFSARSITHFKDTLLYRDFAKFYWLGNGRKFFKRLKGKEMQEFHLSSRSNDVLRWKSGKTGTPIIDAYMRLINSHGHINSRGRSIVSKYFCQDLRKNWKFGAQFFEEKFIDHDIEINYLNWLYAASLGPA